MNIAFIKTLLHILLLSCICRLSIYHHTTWAQDMRCGSRLDSSQTSRNQLNLAISQFLLKTDNCYTLPNNGNAPDFLEVPVVVHIIHKGEPSGTGTNLAPDQIWSQIEALNRDFSRKNHDTTHTPDAFKAIAANPAIRFVAATYDPDGFPLAEAGIHRYNGRREAWSRQDFNRIVKPATVWDTQRYYNIWVTPLQEGLLGYAQFPEVSGFSQPPDMAENALTDGVVIASHAFGAEQFAGEFGMDIRFNKGRTLTHETGHFLGLIHIWGDGGCELDDLCDDTPPADRPSRGCPQDQTSCNSPDMVQNFMDLSADSCMNLFTICQAERMRMMLQNAPRRASLLQSDVARPVKPSAYAGFRLRSRTICINEQLLPENISILIGDSTDLEFYWEFPGASPENSRLKNPSVSYAHTGVFPIILKVQHADSLLIVIDSIEVKATPAVQMPESIAWPDGSLPTSWHIQGAGWKTIPLSGRNVLAASNLLPGQDAQSHLILPPADTRNSTFLVVQLELAYALRPSRPDALSIYKGSGCNTPSTLAAWIDNEALRTTPSSMFPFVPYEHEWEIKRFYIATEGEASTQIAITNINNAGNTLYIRNIKLFTIQETPAPSAQFRMEPALALPNEHIRVSAVSPYPFLYEWTFDGGSPPLGTGNTLTVSYEQAGFFPVTLNTNSGRSSAKEVQSLQVLDGQLLGKTLTEAPFSLPSSGWGSLGGHSNAGDVAKAERFTSLSLHDSLWAIDLYPAILQAADTASIVTVALWEGDQQPERLLTKAEVNYTAMRTAWKEQRAFRVRLNTPIKAPDSFFAGFLLDYTQRDTFAVGVYPAELNSAWEQSPAGIWRPLSLPQTEGGKGRSASLGIRVVSSSGKTTTPAAPYIHLYPNPASTEIRLITPSGSHLMADGIILYSVQGEAVWQQDFPPASDLRISLPQLANGLYIVRIRSNSTFINHKLIIQH